jgi:type VI secretion system protein ImpK
MLASTFHGDVDGGSKCFLLLGRFAMEPQEHSALLELMYRLLSLGFEGQYGGADGRRQLTAIRQRLLEMVTASHGVVPQELSTHWRGEAAVRPAFWRRIPAWLPATLLGLVLCALFAGAGYQLRLKDSELAARLARIGNIDASAPLRPGD